MAAEEIANVTKKLEEAKVCKEAEVSFAGKGLKLNKAEDGKKHCLQNKIKKIYTKTIVFNFS